MKVLLITTKGDYIEKEIDNKLETLQELVGGYIEYVEIDYGVDMIINEEGKVMDLEYNLGATLLYRATHFGSDYICGNVIIVRTNEQGENDNLQDDDIEGIKNIIADEFRKEI